LGSITSTHHNSFIPAQQVYSKILRDWKSFHPTNAIDQGEFPTWTLEVLRDLGSSVMREEEAILKVDNFRAILPEDFHEYYAAYKCHYRGNNTDILYQQNTFNAFSDITIDILKKSPSCEIECCGKDTELIQTIKVRQYVGTGCTNYQFHNPILLTLAPYSSDLWKRHGDEPQINGYDDNNGCPGAPRNHRWNEIGINNNMIHTNFKHDCIYLLYYAYPMDAEGLPMIPNNNATEKAVEWYIKWQLTLNWWFNNEVADVQSKWQKAEEMFLKWFSEAEYQTKLPAFQQMLNSTRNQRTYNKVSYFSRQDWKRTAFW
jgi:hypothetical protein